MDINDFDIKIKKFDNVKNNVIVNIVVCGELEIRGWLAKYSTTKHSPKYPVWFVNPPSVKGRNKQYFWIANLKNPTLWQILQKKIIDEVKEYTDLL